MKEFANFHINKGNFKDTKDHFWLIGYNEGGIGTPLIDLTNDVNWFLEKQKEEAETLANKAMKDINVVGFEGNELILKMRDRMSLLQEIEEHKQKIIKICEQIIANDKSERYNYGEARLSDGKIPEMGQRWLVPREIAETWLKEEIEQKANIIKDNEVKS